MPQQIPAYGMREGWQAGVRARASSTRASLIREMRLPASVPAWSSVAVQWRVSGSTNQPTGLVSSCFIGQGSPSAFEKQPVHSAPPHSRLLHAALSAAIPVRKELFCNAIERSNVQKGE